MKIFSRKNGYSLFFAVIVIGATTLTTVVVLSSLSLASIRSDRVFLESKQARLLADLCAEEALEQIRQNINFSGRVDLTFGNNSCFYLIDNLGNENRAIQVTGLFGQTKQQALVLVDQINPKINVRSWQEVAGF